MRRVICPLFLVLSMVFLVGASEAVIREYVVSFDTSNPPDNEYPGGRGPDQLIVYTQEFGSRTGTNEWGIEAVVEEGKVVQLGGNDHEIPSEGYVLSAHGQARVYLSALAKEGREVHVDFDNKELTITYNPLDRLNSYRQDLSRLQEYREQREDHYGWFEMFSQRRQERSISRAIDSLEKKIVNNPERAFGSEFIHIGSKLDEAWEKVKE